MPKSAPAPKTATVPPKVLRMVPTGTQGQQNYFITCHASEPSRSLCAVADGLQISVSKPWHPAKLSNWYNCILGTAEARPLPLPDRARPGEPSLTAGRRPPGVTGGPRGSRSPGGRRGCAAGPLWGSSGVSAGRDPGAAPPGDGRGM